MTENFEEGKRKIDENKDVNTLNALSLRGEEE